MTYLEAIKAKMYPYELPEETLEFLLSEQGLESSGTYSKDNKTPFMSGVIAALWQCVTLVKEKDNGSEIQYDVDALKDLIKRYSKDIPEEEELKPQNRDMTEIW